MEQWKTLLESPREKPWIDSVTEREHEIGAFLEFDPRRQKTRKEGPLAHLPFAVKDLIAVEGFHLTCGSRMLENLVSPYTATAVEKLISAGGVVVGKTNMDEFGMGSSCDNSALGKTSNPWNPAYVAGGSSGGSAAAVASGEVPFALGSDTGGSVRQPAAFCGVYGLKPTYGSVSRFGLVAYASSLECIGVFGESSEICREVFHIMKGQDPRDNSSVDYAPSGKVIDSPVVGIISGLSEMDEATSGTYRQTILRLEELGYRVKEFDMSSLEYVVPAYYTIATAEASANLARYNGIRYGHRTDYADNPEELVRKSRNEGFGDEVKLRILLGTYVLRSGFQEQYYIRAQKIRTAIRRGFDRIFEEADLIMMPVFPVQGFKHGDDGLDPFQQKIADRFTAAANLAGIPAMAFPGGVENGLPVGMQFLAPAFEEDRLFTACSEFGKAFPIGGKPASGIWRE